MEFKPQIKKESQNSSNKNTILKTVGLIAAIPLIPFAAIGAGIGAFFSTAARKGSELKQNEKELNKLRNEKKEHDKDYGDFVKADDENKALKSRIKILEKKDEHKNLKHYLEGSFRWNRWVDIHECVIEEDIVDLLDGRFQSKSLKERIDREINFLKENPINPKGYEKLDGTPIIYHSKGEKLRIFINREEKQIRILALKEQNQWHQDEDGIVRLCRSRLNNWTTAFSKKNNN